MRKAPRWNKVFRDLLAERGRTIMMVLALTAGVFGVTAMVAANSVLTREIQRNYMLTNPASATIELTKVDREILDFARNFPGVAEAEARAVIQARIRTGDEWQSLLLFVVEDFKKMRLNSFKPVSGEWPPAPGNLLLERSSVPFLGIGMGADIMVKTPHGAPTPLHVSGVTHDTGLSPSQQDRTGYGYITPETLSHLGEPPVLDELRILVDGDPSDTAMIERRARSLARSLRDAGADVHEIRVPPPLRHPHQGQMSAILFMLVIFSGMALGLSFILIATVIAAMLAKQVPEIGAMKAVGARTEQIAAMYLAMVAVLSITALIIGLPLGLLASKALANIVASMLNFDIASYAPSASVYALVITTGIAGPLVFSLPTIRRSSRITVREAITDFGVSSNANEQGMIAKVMAKFGGLNRLTALALRNIFRRRGRLALSLLLLGFGGGMFMTASNVGAAWQDMTNRMFFERFYDVEIRFNSPEQLDRLAPLLATIPEVTDYELWGHDETSFAKPGDIELTRTYPDQGHGSFSIEGAPDETKMVRFPLMSGRWLESGDEGVVLNHVVAATRPDLKVGDQVTLSVSDRPVDLRIVGFVETVGSPSKAFVTFSTYERILGQSGSGEMLRVMTSGTTKTERMNIIRKIDDQLAKANVSVERIIPLGELQTAVGEHMQVLINTLVAAAMLFATIGGLGLMSMMAMNVMERTREIGVMRSIGATPATTVRILTSEGIFIGVVSVGVALPLALLLSHLVGSLIGNMAFKLPLALVLSPGALALWIVIVLVISGLVTSLLALRASRMPVREAIAYL